jgi:outer membrane protein assembly factor BamB
MEVNSTWLTFVDSVVLSLDPNLQLWQQVSYPNIDLTGGGVSWCDILVCFDTSGIDQPNRPAPNERLFPSLVHDPANNQIIGTMGAAAFGMSAGTGVVLWERETVTSGNTPAVQNGILLTNEPDKQVLAYRLSDVKRLWIAKLDAAPISSPVVASNRVLITGADGFLYAFDWQTGAKLWSAQIGNPCSAFENCPGSPVVIEALGGNMIVVGSNDNDVYAYRLDGTRAWRVSLDSPAVGSPAVINGRIYVATRTRLFALR